MDKRIVNIDGGYKSYDAEFKILEQAGYTLEIFGGTMHDRAGKIKFSQGAVGLFCRWTVLNREFLKALPGLKAIVRYGVGYDNVDINAATSFNVKEANVQGYANHSVSEHALALIFNCTRAISTGEKQFYTNYTKPPLDRLFELHDKTLGIIGLGRIGGTLSRKAKSLFKHIIAYDPYIANEGFEAVGAACTDLESLLRQSHVISLHCNLSEETTGLIGQAEFDKMQQIPILINTSRGAVINEEALLVALNKNQIHSAGLDVYSEEPPGARFNHLLKHPKVVKTGHYAWYSEESSRELQRRAAENMLALLKNQIPDDCLNP